MDGNFSQVFGAHTNPEDVRAMVSEVMSDAFRALPRPKVPSWVEAWADFIKAHPWISLGTALFVLLVLSLVIREIICSYLKTNEILRRLKNIEEKIR